MCCIYKLFFNTQNYIPFKIVGLYFKYSQNFANFSLEILIKHMIITILHIFGKKHVIAQHNILKHFCAQYGLTFDHSVSEIYLIMHKIWEVKIYKWELFIDAV